MLTDYALGVANLFFAISILRGIHSKNRVTGLLLSLGFFAEALSAFAGGTFHGFSLYLPSSTLRQFWNVVTLSIGAAIGFLVSAIHAAHVHRREGKWIVAGVVGGVAGLSIQATGYRAHQDFNHNDLFHIVQIAAMYAFYRGVTHLRDRAYSPR